VQRSGVAKLYIISRYLTCHSFHSRRARLARQTLANSLAQQLERILLSATSDCLGFRANRHAITIGVVKSCLVWCIPVPFDITGDADSHYFSEPPSCEISGLACASFRTIPTPRLSNRNRRRIKGQQDVEVNCKVQGDQPSRYVSMRVGASMRRQFARCREGRQARSSEADLISSIVPKVGPCCPHLLLVVRTLPLPSTERKLPFPKELL
jgi:hypothetical protein